MHVSAGCAPAAVPRCAFLRHRHSSHFSRGSAAVYTDVGNLRTHRRLFESEIDFLRLSQVSCLDSTERRERVKLSASTISRPKVLKYCAGCDAVRKWLHPPTGGVGTCSCLRCDTRFLSAQGPRSGNRLATGRLFIIICKCLRLRLRLRFSAAGCERLFPSI